MKELKKIDISLQQLQQDFNKQLQALGSDSKEFHSALIDLSSKYPDHKDLLQFIVFINDKLEINQNIFHEIVCDSLNELIRLKKDLVCDIIEIHGNIPTKQMNFIEKVKDFVSSIKNIKIIITGIAVIILGSAVLIDPAMFLKIITALTALF